VAVSGGRSHLGRLVDDMEYAEVLPDGSDAWRASKVVDLLQSGGVGVLPTDVSYSFVTPVSSRSGVERILRLKGAAGGKKPLSLLCRDLSEIDKYTYGIDRITFKLLKRNLPGPFTFILPASSELPKMIYQDKRGAKKKWKRSEIGIRVPNDGVLLSILEQLDEPLLCSTLPVDEDSGAQIVCHVSHSLRDGADWCSQVDFILDAGERPVDGSTIYDLTQESPVLVREGLGDTTLNY